MAALNALPNELLSLIANHLDRPKDILNIALSSRRLHEFVKLDGWKAFLRGRLGLVDLDSDAKNAVHGLTTIYRNWDRKAFMARYLESSQQVTSLNSWERKQWRGPQAQGQTMGYQPSIDSYEELDGNWTDRREALAWSVGTQVVLRIKETGMKAATTLLEHQAMGEEADRTCDSDHFKHANSWYTYKIPQSVEGRDDVTALKLLRPPQKMENFEHIIIGTASGQLSMLDSNLKLHETIVKSYETGERPISSLSVSSSNDPLLAATLGTTSLTLYPIDRDHQSGTFTTPLSEISPIIPGSRSGRIWSCNFISNDTVALGLGPSYEPIQVYEVTPTGYSSEPLRKFNLDSKYWAGNVANRRMQCSGSVYPIVPIPNDAETGSAANRLFLSGGYDGIVRLHDMRSDRNFETLFWDVTNDSSIYSLACQGSQRFVVGSSMHSMLKVFDLRFSGPHAYHSIPNPTKPQPRCYDYTYNAIVDRAGLDSSARSGGWNVYLNPRNGIHQQANRRRIEDSPVYSLSIPSARSPNLYAGLEGVVQNLTFLSVLDQHPDPLFAQSTTRFTDTGHVDLKSSYNPNNDVLNLGMYEQGTDQSVGMQLLVQDGISSALTKNKERKDFARHRGLDERWIDPSEDAEKWAKGQEPQGPVRREGNRGRGHGRGRGRARGGAGGVTRGGRGDGGRGGRGGGGGGDRSRGRGRGGE
jgi:WD40 repeat protein